MKLVRAEVHTVVSTSSLFADFLTNALNEIKACPGITFSIRYMLTDNLSAYEIEQLFLIIKKYSPKEVLITIEDIADKKTSYDFLTQLSTTLISKTKFEGMLDDLNIYHFDGTNIYLKYSNID